MKDTDRIIYWMVAMYLCIMGGLFAVALVVCNKLDVIIEQTKP